MNGRLSSEFAEAADSPGLMLWRVTHSWQAALRAALAPFGLTHVQFVLLASLSWLGSDTLITQRELADHAQTDPMMTSQVLRALEAKRLIRRAPHPVDARARALTVTTQGAALADAANTVVEQTDRAFFAPLANQQPDFTELLQRLALSHR